jgi:hypothetical protein
MIKKIAQRHGHVLLVLEDAAGVVHTVYLPMLGSVKRGDDTIHSDTVLHVEPEEAK